MIMIPDLLMELRSKAPKCFLCKWILEDLEKHGELTKHPTDSMGQAVFPIEGKQKHLILEGLGVFFEEEKK